MVHVLSAQSPAWAGQRGRINPAVLTAALPADLTGWEVFVRGPNPMMDTAEAWCAGTDTAVHSERFTMV